MKPGRNDPCWCGSGIKYKKCHLNREEQKRITMQDAIQEQIKAKEKFCLHPNAKPNVCNKIIKAHSIQKANILKYIARNQHVYNFNAEFGELKKRGRLEPKLIGINDATTFTGFCNYHDTETFRPIESNGIEINNEHIFLLAYRALCKEIYAKKFQLKMTPLMKEGDKGLLLEDQIAIQRFSETYSKAVQAGLNDLIESKKSYDSYLLSENFSDISYYVIEIETLPDIVVSGQIHVEMDFNGNVLHTHADIIDFSKKLDNISFSIVMRNSNGLIVFSCFNKEKKSIEFLKSIDTITDIDLPNSIVRFAFEFFENNFISPDWWEGLSAKSKEAIIKRMNNSVSFVERSNSVLEDDGNRYVNWKILNRYKSF